MAEKLNERRCLPVDAEDGFWMAADGWPIRRLTLPAAGRVCGSILFAGGRADFAEKYIESLLHWRASGWRVIAFDWRGQGGSGRLPGVPEGLGHIDDFKVWLDDAAGLVADWIKSSPGPHVLIGHSMGGHLMLRHVEEHHPAVAGLVLSSPMIRFKAPVPGWLLGRLASIKTHKGQGAAFAWGQGVKRRAARGLRQRRLTTDRDRYADELWWQHERPEYMLGGVSWGWLDAACRSADVLVAPGLAEKVSIPVLLVATAHDRVVDTPAAVALINRIPQHEIALFAGGHELLREVDNIRLDAWRRIDRFLDECSDG